LVSFLIIVGAMMTRCSSRAFLSRIYVKPLMGTRSCSFLAISYELFREDGWQETLRRRMALPKRNYASDEAFFVTIFHCGTAASTAANAALET
jgi:hypothetical protein